MTILTLVVLVWVSILFMLFFPLFIPFIALTVKKSGIDAELEKDKTNGGNLFGVISILFSWCGNG